MADEKIFTVPLRKAYRGGHRKTRSERAIKVIRQYLERHMKTEEIKIGKTINEAVWARGIQKPPRRVRIHATLENSIAYAELIGTDIKTPSASEVKEKQKKKKEKREKIKEDRKERKKQSIQEELDESGKEAETKEPVEETVPKETYEREVVKQESKDNTKK